MMKLMNRNNNNKLRNFKTSKMKKNLLILVVITMMMATTIQAQIPTNGLVAYYPFSGNANDSSGKGNNLSNNIKNVTYGIDRFGKANSCVNFSGSGEYLNKANPSLPSGNSDRTLSVWFNPTNFSDTTQNISIIGYGAFSPVGSGACFNQYTVTISKAGCDVWGRCNDLSGSFSKVPYGWHHLLVTYTSVNNKGNIYYDNSLIRSGQLYTTLNTQLTNLILGSSLNESGIINSYNGLLDDIRIYNRALDSTEVQTLYHEGGYGIVQNNTNDFKQSWLTLIDSAKTSVESYEMDAGSFMNPISQKLAISLDGLTLGAIGTSNSDITIKSLNTINGKIKFQYSYPNSGTDAGRAIQIDNKGFFHTLGSLNISTIEGTLISKLDTNGVVIFNHFNKTTDTREVGTTLEIDKRTGVSYYNSENWTGSVNLSKLHIINNNGDSLTTNIITDYDWYEGWPGRMTKDNLGNYIFNGKYQTNVPYYGIVIRKVDSLGNTKWTTRFNQHTSQMATVLKCDSLGNVLMTYQGQGGYAITGVAKFDANTGTLLWDQVINPNKYGARNLSVLSSGNFIVAIDTGTINYYNSQNGSQIWSRSGLKNSFPLSIDKSNNIYQVAGDTILILSSTGNILFKSNLSIKGYTVDLRYILADNMDGVFYVGGNATSGTISNMFVSKFTNNGSVLPLEISNIGTTSKAGVVNIYWTTATEQNTSNFIIQHSSDGNSFIDIGAINALGSVNGNSYSYIHNNPVIGINYYRLKSVEKDGIYSYSKVVSVNFGDNQSFSIIPNPARDFASISFSKSVEKAIITVYDLTGKQVIKQSHSGSANNYKLNTQTLKSGLYVIKVNTATGDYNEKLLINK